MQSLASRPPAVQPVENVHQPGRNRGDKRNYVPHVDHIGDHTADSANNAVIAAFAPLPAHMKRTLTWDSEAWR